jgi:hypothetical protein
MTPIPADRLAALARLPLCAPARAWLAGPSPSYEDLVSIPEGPHWALLSAMYYGGPVDLLQAVVISAGSPDIRRKFAAHVPGADKAALLAGL